MFIATDAQTPSKLRQERHVPGLHRVRGSHTMPLLTELGSVGDGSCANWRGMQYLL